MPTADIKLDKYKLLTENKELLADLETPVSTFYKVCEGKSYSFLLESVEGGENLGRYSFIGTEPILIFKSENGKTTLENKIENSIIEIEENPFTALNDLISSIEIKNDEIKEFIGFVGYFGYENVRWIEPKLDLKSFKDLPDVCLMLPGKIIVFDHIMNKVNLIAVEIENKKSTTKTKLEELVNDLNKNLEIKQLELNYKSKDLAEFKSNFKKEEYLNVVKEAKEYIYKGDIFQIVPSQKFTVHGKHDGLSLYRALRSINPSPFLYYLNLDEFELAGSSPEIMVQCEKINSERIASVRPIAGTYPRGQNEEEDKKNIEALSSDPKERAEHLMLVDLARNDLGRACETGSINVKELMTIEKYSHVFHMVSLVQGILKDSNTCVDLLKACLPHGTLSGAPKVRAMELINKLEPAQRGPYGGCLGFFGLNDTIKTCITIRTFIIYKDRLEIQAGGGVVMDSDPENEYQETLRKGAALLKAISLIS